MADNALYQMPTEYLVEMIETLQLSNKTQTEMINQLNQTVANLTETIRQMERKIFGFSSEKSRSSSCPGQIGLFDDEDKKDGGLPAGLQGDEAVAVAGYSRKKKKDKSTHEEIFGNLPVDKRVILLSDEEKICGWCGSRMTHLGEKYVREEIEITPAVVTRVQYYQETAICQNCKEESGETEIIAAQVPEALIPHSMASPSAVAYIMYQKYVMGDPCYRLEKDFEQMGVRLGRGTMSSWINVCGENYFLPLYRRMHEMLLARDVIGADETRCQVLHEEGKSPQSTSFMWLYQSTIRGEKPIILYEYQPTRGGYHAADFLKGFKGFLICDGYQGYNRLKNVTRCGCWAHLRRYFFDALPGKSKVDKEHPTPAEIGYAYCNKLFELEAKYKELEADERKRRRLLEERPVLDAFWKWLDTVIATGGSRLAKAVNYAQNQRPYMENYLLDGRCEISNNISENYIRPYAVGRKNFLFHDTVDGANASAVIYSLVMTAKANNLNIQKYLETVLTLMPGCKMGSAGMDDLLPWSDKMQSKCSLKKPGEPG